MPNNIQKIVEIILKVTDSTGSGLSKAQGALKTFTDATKQLDNLQVFKNMSAQSERLNKTLEASQDRLKTLKIRIAELESSQERLNAKKALAQVLTEKETKQYEKQEKALKKFEKEQVSVTNAIEKTENAVTKQKTAMDALSASLSKAGVDTTKLADAEAKLTKTINDTRAAADREAQLQKARSVIGVRSNTEIKAAIQEVIKSYDQLKKSGAASFVELARYKTAAKEQVRSLTKELAGVDRKFTDIAIAMQDVFQLGVLGGAFKSIINSAAELEYQLKVTSVVAAKTNNEIGSTMDTLSEKARELGRSSVYSSKQVAEGMQFMAMAGLSTKDILGGIESALGLATAGNIDLGRATDIVTNIMTAFNMTAEEMSATADVLVQTFVSTNTNLVELGDAFKYVGAISKSAGADIKDVSAALGALSNAGIKSTMAGTALRGTFSALLNPTKKEAELMQDLAMRIGDLNFSILDSEGNFIGFTNLIKKLEDAGISTGEALELFGDRAGTGISTLLVQGSKKLEELLALNNKASGRYKQIAEEMKKTFSGALNILKNNFNDLSITIGDIFLPIMTKLVKSLTTAARALNNFALAHPDAVKGIVGLATALTSLVVISKLGTIWGMIFGTKGAIAFFLSQFTLISTKLTTFIAFLNTTAIGTPLILALTKIKDLLIIIGTSSATLFAGSFIVALASIGTALLQTSDKFRDFVNEVKVGNYEVGKSFADMSDKFVNFIQNIGIGPITVRSLMQDLIALFEFGFKKIWDIIKTYIYNYPVMYFEKLLASFTGLIAKLAKELQGSKFSLLFDKMFDTEQSLKDLELYSSTVSAIFKTFAEENAKEIEKIGESSDKTTRKFWSIFDAVEAEEKALKRAANEQKTYNEALERGKIASSEYDKDLEKLNKRFQEKSERLLRINNQYQQLESIASSTLDKIGKSVEENIALAWEQAESSFDITSITDKLAEVQTAAYSFESNRVNKIKQLENELSMARVDAAKTAARKTISELNKEASLREKFIKATIKDEYFQKKEINDVTKEITKKKIEANKKVVSALEAAIEDSVKKEKDYRDEIKRILKEIDNLKAGGEKEIREIRRSTMDEEEQYFDRQAEMREKLKIGNAELAKGTAESLAKSNQAFVEARELAASLNTEVTKNGEVIITKQEGAENAIEGVTAALKGQILVQQKTAQMAEQQMSAQQQQQKELRFDLEMVQSQFERLQVEAAKGIKFVIDADTTLFDAKINELLKLRDKKITIEADAKKAQEELDILKAKRDEAIKRAVMEIETNPGKSKEILEELAVELGEIEGKKKTDIEAKVEGAKKVEEFQVTVENLKGEKRTIIVPAIDEKGKESFATWKKEAGETVNLDLSTKNADVGIESAKNKFNEFKLAVESPQNKPKIGADPNPAEQIFKDVHGYYKIMTSKISGQKIKIYVDPKSVEDAKKDIGEVEKSIEDLSTSHYGDDEKKIEYTFYGSGSTTKPIMEKLAEIGGGFEELNAMVSKPVAWTVNAYGSQGVKITESLRKIALSFKSTVDDMGKYGVQFADIWRNKVFGELEKRNFFDIETYKKTLEEARELAINFVDDLIDKYNDLADEIKEVDEEILNIQKDSTQKIREFNRSLMTDELAFADLKLQANETYTKAVAEMTKGNFKSAKELFIEAQDLASQLGKKIEDVAVTAKDAWGNLPTDLKEINKLIQENEQESNNLRSELRTEDDNEYHKYLKDRRYADETYAMAVKELNEGNYQTAYDLLKKSQDLAKSLAREVKDENGVVIRTTEQTAWAAEQLIGDAQKKLTELLTKYAGEVEQAQTEAQKGMVDTNQEAIDLMTQAEKGAVDAMEGLKQSLVDQQSDISSAVMKSVEEIKKLEKEIEKLIRIQERAGTASEDSVKKTTDPKLQAYYNMMAAKEKELTSLYEQRAAAIEKASHTPAGMKGTAYRNPASFYDEAIFAAEQRYNKMVQSLKQQGLVIPISGSGSSVKPISEKIDEIKKGVESISEDTEPMVKVTFVGDATGTEYPVIDTIGNINTSMQDMSGIMAEIDGTGMNIKMTINGKPAEETLALAKQQIADIAKAAQESFNQTWGGVTMPDYTKIIASGFDKNQMVTAGQALGDAVKTIQKQMTDIVNTGVGSIGGRIGAYNIMGMPPTSLGGSSAEFGGGQQGSYTKKVSVDLNIGSQRFNAAMEEKTANSFINVLQRTQRTSSWN
jgi:TP901 family phage tail tape measure protein